MNKTNFGYTEAIPLRKSTKIKASLQKEDRVEETMSDVPLLAKQMSPRLNIKSAGQNKEFLSKGKPKIEDRRGDSPRQHLYRSVKEKSLIEPVSAANLPAATCEPYQEPCGGGSLKEDYGKSLEAERIQCEEKLLALRIRKWQQGMQMSEDERHYPESDPMLAETSYLESEDHMYPQQELRAKILSAEHSDLETQKHVEAEEEEKMLEKAGEEHGLHLSRDNLSELKHESERFFSEDEALAQRIIKWQQDVVKEQAAQLESSRTGAHPQVHAETTTELGEEVKEASSEILPQLKKSFSAKSARDRFFMNECAAESQDQLSDYPQWPPSGQLYTERRETTLQRDSEDFVKKDKALAADNLKMQQNVVEKEHRAKIYSQSQQHVVCSELKAHSSSFDREDELVDMANEPYSVPLPSSSAHATEALPLKSSVHASESEDMEMEKTQKKDKDAFFVDKAKSQHSTDIRDTEAENTENQQKTCGEITIERCEYGPINEEVFVQESAELKEANNQTQKSKRIKDNDDAGAGSSPPVFVKEISSLKTKVGEMSEFTCQFHGDPLPTVTWFKDGQPLTHNPDFDIMNRANKSKLTVFYPTADHEGTYDCLITNKYGKSLCSCTLEIADKIARTADVTKHAAADLPKKGEQPESVFEKELSASVQSGKATLQVPEMVMHRQLCSDEPFSPSPVEIRITTATPVPEIRGENHETKPQNWTEEVSTMAGAEGSSTAVRHKFTFSFDVSEEEPTAVKKSLNTNYSEGITGDVQTPEIFHQQYQDVTHKEEKSICPQPEEAPRTKKTKHAISTEHPGISGCGLLASSAVIKVSEIKQAFEADSSVPLTAPPPKHDRKETVFPEERISAAAVSIDLRDNKGETDQSPVVRDSSPNISPDLAKTLPDGAEANVTEISPASGKLSSDQSVSPQLPATALTSSESPQPISLEENSRQVCPKIPKGANSTEGDGASKKFLDMVQESSAPSPKQDSCDMEMGMSVHTFDRSSSFIPFLSEKENLSMRTSGQLQATVKPKRTSGSIKPESQNAVAMSSSLDSEVDVVREVVPTDAKEASVLEESKEDQLKVVTDANIVTAVLEYTEETSSSFAELISKPEPTFDSGVFLSEVETQPDITKIAEETPGYEGELDVLNNGAQERVNDPQTLLVNPKVDDIPGQHHLSEDGATESRVTSTQDKHFSKYSETKADIATVGSLEEEEVTFGAVYDYYNLPADWRRPMSPESEMSIEIGSTMSEEITEVAERFFTPGSSSEVLQPLVEQFYTPTSPMALHTRTSVTPGGFVTPQEYPFNPAEAQSPSSRQSSERFFTPHELLSSPVEWSMDTTAVNKNLLFNQGMESSSLTTLEEKAQGVPPAFLKPLMKKRVCENDSLMFLAEVFGLPCPEVKWFCNNKQLVEDDRVRMERDGDTVSLTVLDVTKADQGEYICEAVNNIGQARSVALVVVVSQEVRFMPAPPAVTHQHVMEFDVEEDDTSRSPSPQEILLEVELDENEVKEFEKQVKIITIPEYTADNKSMIVSLDVLPSIYEEGAVDFVTHERDDLKIAFEVTEMPPRFINPICDMETPEGATIIFECSLMGTPSPVVSWFKGDKKIPHNDKKYLHSSEGDNHFLKICTVTTQDSGVYICRAINVVGETLCRASLVVVNAKSFSGRTRGREVTAVSLGSAKIQPQKFDLLVGGKSFDGEQVSEIELEFEFDQEADESQRAVKLVAKTDHQAETSEQGEKYVSINFDVFAEPAKEEKVEFKGKSSDMCSFQFQVTESPPKCIIPLSNITAAVGTPVILQCLVSGTPNPTAEWYKDGDRVTDSRCIIQEKTLGHFNLLITNVTQSDAGEYKCIIQNAAGLTETAALLKVF
ncbi:muscle M-line assembly protein unc-89-like isoform X1 [Takifugu flavidus]|uniref:muscle M-line assembly protein unc-89-like isoform X1 n=1 Tax=Takifugu flavidus TaxID=433684 RepID=UPI0025446B15|nr:muscle M-line assembly protein unc-89-like isoform X1 [Takifugu flavidus]